MAGKNALVGSRRHTAAASTVNTYADGDTGFARLRLDQLVGRSDNRELRMEGAERLADSIEADGLGQPLLVRPAAGERDMFEIVSGHHRREAYRILQRRHPNNPEYMTLPCFIRRSLDDARARRLMLATNVVCESVPAEERGRMLEELGREIPRMRECDPTLKGKRTSAIVAELVEEATGQKMSDRTVRRNIKAAKDALCVGGEAERLSGAWREEFSRRSYPAQTLGAVAGLDAAAQSQLYARFEAAGRRKDWLDVEAGLLQGKGGEITAKAIADARRSLALAERCAAGWDEATAARIRSALDMLGETVEGVSCEQCA